MSTRTVIHVHVGPNDSYDSVITRLLNHGFTISVALTNDLEAIGERTARQRIADARIEADRFIAERDARQAEQERRYQARAEQVAKRMIRDGVPSDQELRQRAYDQRYTIAQEARGVECSSCGAKVDDPCTTPEGKAYGAFAHIDRIRAANTARGQ
jgi:hypothetical protein